MALFVDSVNKDLLSKNEKQMEAAMELAGQPLTAAEVPTLLNQDHRGSLEEGSATNRDVALAVDMAVGKGEKPEFTVAVTGGGELGQVLERSVQSLLKGEALPRVVESAFLRFGEYKLGKLMGKMGSGFDLQKTIAAVGGAQAGGQFRFGEVLQKAVQAAGVEGVTRALAPQIRRSGLSKEDVRQVIVGIASGEGVDWKHVTNAALKAVANKNRLGSGAAAVAQEVMTGEVNEGKVMPAVAEAVANRTDGAGGEFLRAAANQAEQIRADKTTD